MDIITLLLDFLLGTIVIGLNIIIILVLIKIITTMFKSK